MTGKVVSRALIYTRHVCWYDHILSPPREYADCQLPCLARVSSRHKAVTSNMETIDFDAPLAPYTIMTAYRKANGDWLRRTAGILQFCVNHTRSGRTAAVMCQREML